MVLEELRPEEGSVFEGLDEEDLAFEDGDVGDQLQFGTVGLVVVEDLMVDELVVVVLLDHDDPASPALRSREAAKVLMAFLHLSFELLDGDAAGDVHSRLDGALLPLDVDLQLDGDVALEVALKGLGGGLLFEDEGVVGVDAQLLQGLALPPLEGVELLVGGGVVGP